MNKRSRELSNKNINKEPKPCLHWAKQTKYKSVISWSDNRWGEGNIYTKLGFELTAELQPDYSYVDFRKPLVRISKQSQKKSNTKCPKDKTEHEWALENGLARIWDCGKKQWTLNI